jgi:hypothetical protein
MVENSFLRHAGQDDRVLCRPQDRPLDYIPEISEVKETLFLFPVENLH